jgi:hypothetical protein
MILNKKVPEDSSLKETESVSQYAACNEETLPFPTTQPD